MNDSSVFHGNSFLGDMRESGPFRFGRVDACINHEYVTLCDDSWNNLAASVVCNQLGLSPYGVHKLSLILVTLLVILIFPLELHYYSNNCARSL